MYFSKRFFGIWQIIQGVSERILILVHVQFALSLSFCFINGWIRFTLCLLKYHLIFTHIRIFLGYVIVKNFFQEWIGVSIISQLYFHFIATYDFCESSRFWQLTYFTLKIWWHLKMVLGKFVSTIISYYWSFKLLLCKLVCGILRRVWWNPEILS